ncbi:MAG: Ig-like domain-containing protein [Verrucomicrobiota bacterium]
MSGPVLTINPSNDLLNGKWYSVRLDPSAIQDTSGNAFAGITNNTTWNFTTVSNGISNTYVDWIGGYPAAAAEDGFLEDFDLDGTANGLESYFGTDPTVDTGGLNAMYVVGPTFTFEHPVNSNPPTDVTAGYSWSKDLVTWHADGATDGEGTTVNFAPGAPVGAMMQVDADISGVDTTRLHVRIGVVYTP